MNARTKKPAPKPAAEKPTVTIKKTDYPLAQCLLEHAARETQWMREYGKGCDYLAAATAAIRRDVWLHAAMLAQERKV